MQGHIKLLVKEKMFGFIKGEDGVDYFFHHSALKNVKFEALQTGDEVTFEETKSLKGNRAEDIYA